MSQDEPYSILPAHLDFISIYNPELDDEAQLVFHYNPRSRRRRRRKLGQDQNTDERQDGNARSQDEHRRMRQIGLAQGIVSFARSFSGKKDVDSVETEKRRTVLKELEKGWWVLASVHLTCIQYGDPSSTKDKTSAAQNEYSSREVSPSMVLAQQLLRAHRIFTLHHSHSLSDLFVKLSVTRFRTLLEHYWTGFADHWDVMLHENPAADALSGIRLAGGGELGVGVGEEEWGSAEREYLEELVRTTEGLADMVVYRSRPGAKDLERLKTQPKSHPQELAEGVIFSGIRTLTPHSILALSEWMASIAAQGTDAYGVTNNPIRGRPRRSPRVDENVIQTNEGPDHDQNAPQLQTPAADTAHSLEPRRPAIPPPVLTSTPDPTSESKRPAIQSSKSSMSKEPTSKTVSSQGDRSNEDGWMNYLTLGYGSRWGGSSTQAASGSTKPASEKDGKKDRSAKDDHGHFLIGLTGALEEETIKSPREDGSEDDLDGGSRLSIRTVHVETLKQPTKALVEEKAKKSSKEEADTAKALSTGTPVAVSQRLRLIVYQHKPFIYAFLFEQDAASLAMHELYRELHQKLQPLHKALSLSTSPERIAARMQAVLSERVTESAALTPIYDFVHDPTTLVLRTNIPNIPSFRDDDQPGSVASSPTWNRLEALSVYSHILALLSDTRERGADYERSVKTGRSWWVTWMRLACKSKQTAAEQPKTDAEDAEAETEAERETEPESITEFRDAILVRQASENTASAKHKRGASTGLGRLSLSGGTAGFNRLIGRESNSGSDTSSTKRSEGAQQRGLTEGVGLDARRYVEALFHLNR